MAVKGHIRQVDSGNITVQSHYNGGTDIRAFDFSDALYRSVQVASLAIAGLESYDNYRP